jgi:hypothetical protein
MDCASEHESQGNKNAKFIGFSQINKPVFTKREVLAQQHSPIFSFFPSQLIK